ncbi:hypothetical protein STAL104432_31820 [Streptomyces albus]
MPTAAPRPSSSGSPGPDGAAGGVAFVTTRPGVVSSARRSLMLPLSSAIRETAEEWAATVPSSARSSPEEEAICAASRSRSFSRGARCFS